LIVLVTTHSLFRITGEGDTSDQLVTTTSPLASRTKFVPVDGQLRLTGFPV